MEKGMADNMVRNILLRANTAEDVAASIRALPFDHEWRRNAIRFSKNRELHGVRDHTVFCEIPGTAGAVGGPIEAAEGQDPRDGVERQSTREAAAITLGVGRGVGLMKPSMITYSCTIITICVREGPAAAAGNF